MHQLHASDLRTLSPSSFLPSLLKSSPSARSFQYLTPSSPSLSQRAQAVSSLCASRLVSYTPGDTPSPLDVEHKHVVSLTLPELNGAGEERRSTMSAYEEQLGEELSKLTREFPNHLVIYAGVPTQELRARQASVSPLVEAAAAAKVRLVSPFLLLFLLNLTSYLHFPNRNTAQASCTPTKSSHQAL
jgi:hypothetical protein